MVLCDAVHQDPATGKFTILGTFNTFTAAQFPSLVRFSIYFSVTDGFGLTPLSLRVVGAASGLQAGDADDAGFPILQLPPLEFEFADPLAVLESVADIGFELPRPGLYHCELLAGTSLLMSRRLLALQGPAPPGNAFRDGGVHQN